ncbi:hypothetical protein U1Q18_030107 [Sarracenia purpurea var. burkii]
MSGFGVFVVWPWNFLLLQKGCFGFFFFVSFFCAAVDGEFLLALVARMGCPTLALFCLGYPFLCLVLVALFGGSSGCVVGVLDAGGVFAAIVGLGLALAAEVMQAVIALDPVFCCFKFARALMVCFKSASRVVVFGLLQLCENNEA